MHYLLFRLADAEFGIPITDVREVLRAPVIHQIPQAPGFLEGVIALRKHTLAVVDLRKKLSFTNGPNPASLHLLVVRVSGMIIGITVDRAMEVIGIAQEHIDSLSTVAPRYIDGKTATGVAHLGDRVIILLDLAQLLNPEETKLLQEAR